MVDSKLTCGCGDDLHKMRVFGASTLLACFRCMKLYQQAAGAVLIPFQSLKRNGLGNWSIGSNVQTQKNLLWETDLEELFSLWIAKKVLE